MDISKLPRMSKTTTPPNEAGPDVPVPQGSGFPVIPAGETSPQPPPAAPEVWCKHCHAPNAAGSLFCNSCGASLRESPPAPNVQPGIGAEVWVAAIVGIVLMLMGMNFARWAVTTLTGGTYHTGVEWQVGERAGQEVEYWDLIGFAALQDTAIFLFGLAMVLEAAVLAIVHSRFRAKRPLLALAVTVTLAATMLNLLVAVKLFSAGTVPLLSLLAVAFGGYIVAYEWRLFQHFARSAQRA